MNSLSDVRDRHSFYRSGVWQKFRRYIIDKRLLEQGEIICDVCGKSIVNKYDCILHHKQELTDDNYNDANISLNPDNISIICFNCHNDIHSRFGAAGSHKDIPTHNIYLVWGSPCSGKSQWVEAQAQKNDVIIDLNNIIDAITTNEESRSKVLGIALDLYNKLLEKVKYRSIPGDAYVIKSISRPIELRRLADDLDVTSIIHIDTPENVCISNAEYLHKSPDYINAIKKYWQNFYTYEQLLTDDGLI